MKTITAICFLLLFSPCSFCCDNCNVYQSLSPDDGKHSLGFVFRSREMQGFYTGLGLQTLTKHAAHGNDPKFWGNQVTELFRTYELRGEFQIKNRWKTYLVVPFVQNSQYINSVERYTVTGFADPIVLQGFQIIDPTKIQKFENISQRLEVGLGAKAPLGKIDKIVNNESPNLDLQPGSGSWDILGFAKYLVTINNFGSQLIVNYKWNTPNKDDYKYGNVLNGTLNLFYTANLKSLTLLPMINANIESATYDESFETHFDTGGTALFAGGGIQMFWKGIRLFGEYQKALRNQFNGYTQLINKYKVNVGLSYYF